jgi:deoxyribodipyrimidine photo-lyase
MQQAQRVEENPALTLAIAEANRLGLPPVVGFALSDRYPEANRRHYTFMLEGLREVAAALADQGIRFVLRLGEPDRVVLELGRQAALIVCDRGYLRHQRRWRRAVGGGAQCPVVEVETDVVVPTAVASDKAEYAARTLRPKILRQMDRFLQPAGPPLRPVHPSLELDIAGEDPADIPGLLDRLRLAGPVAAVSDWFTGGTGEARRRFQLFLNRSLDPYAAHAHQPQTDHVSMMSPYLHFGQISPVWLARRVREAECGPESRAAFLEELVVRRELAVNFVCHTPDYDAYDGLPDWARETLAAHAADTRPHLYTPAQLEAGQTHDPYWNAAMAEMRATGFMHNYMRMYWGKQVLAWSPSPREAFATLLALNNRYFLDGRDPNSYAGVAWIFGRHDRPWPERPVFGKVRAMTASGLRRKCDIEAYVRKVALRSAASPRSG